MNLTEEARPEVCFYLVNGNILKSVSELAIALDSMTDEEFNHHVNKERNDFVNWIKDIYQNKELTRALLKCKKRKDAKKIIQKAISEEEKALKKKKKILEEQAKKGLKKNLKEIKTPKKRAEILKLLKA